MNKRLTFLFAVVWCVCLWATLAKAWWPDHYGHLRDSGLPSSGSGVNDVVNYDDWYGTCMATDAAVTPINVFTPKCIYPGADPANGTGGNIIVSGSPGERTITGTTRAGTAGDTIAFVVQLNTGASSTTTLTEGVSYVCAAAASDIECICNLKAAVAAHATLGSIITANSTDATCSDEKLSFGVVPGASWQLSVTPSDTTNMVMSNGTDGVVALRGSCVEVNTNSASSIFASNQFGTRIYWGTTCGAKNVALYASSFTSDPANFIGVENAGNGTTGYSLAVNKGAKSLSTLKQATVTFAGGGGAASGATTTSFISAGYRANEVTGYVTVTGTTCTSIDVGTAADPDLYCDNCAVAAGTTFSRAIGGLMPGYTAEPANSIGGADEVLITANGGNCVSLAVRLTIAPVVVTADTTL